MEEKMNAAVAAGKANVSKNKKSGSKKKKSGGKISKRRSSNKPEPGQEPASEVEAETETETAPGHVESSSPASKKRKSGSDCSEIEEEEVDEVLAENQKGKSVVEDSASGKSDAEPSKRDQAGKGKKRKSENDRGGTEPLASGGLPRQLRPRKQQATMQDVILTDADISRVIGRRIKVFWPLDVKWYSGRVKSFDGKKKRHHVLYDDGDEEWLDLKKEKFKLQVYPGEAFGEPVQPGAEPVDAPPADDSKNSEGKRKDGGVDKNKKTDGKRNEEEEEAEAEEEEEEDKEEKVNDSAVGKEKSQGQAVDGVSDAKKPKSLKRTAPRTKRLGSIKQIHQKDVGEDQAKDAEKKQDNTEQADGKQEAKQDEESRLIEQMNPSETIPFKEGSTDDKEGEKQLNGKSIGSFPGNKNDVSDLGGSEQAADLLDAEQIDVNHSAGVNAKGLKLPEQVDEIQVEKQSEQTENLDEKEATGIVTDQPDEKETFERQVLKQSNEDGTEMRPKISKPQDEKQSDAKEYDDTEVGKQNDVVGGADTVSKKHSNKKHRGRGKGRETGKR